MDKSEIQRKQGILGLGVLLLGESGRLVLALLTHYDASSDSYEAVAFHPGTIKVAVIGGTEGEQIPGVGKKETEICYAPMMRGLRRYPYEARPDYAFQFVYPGEDTEPLYQIAQRNMAAGATAPVAQPAPDAGENRGGDDVPAPPAPPVPTTEDFSPADYDKDGVVTRKEKKRYNREQEQAGSE